VVLAEWCLAQNRHSTDLAETSPHRIVNVSAQVTLALCFRFGLALYSPLGFLCLDHHSHLLNMSFYI
jgi:hypothetical protein